MTLEEARKEIKAHVDEQWEEFEKTGSLFCQGYAFGGNTALGILYEIDSEPDSEPVGNPEQLTLKELAREMRKLFEFDYVTVDANESITFWVRKPLYISMCGLWERNTYLNSWDIFDIDFSRAVNLDLSEYAGESGEIDYSRCIVEVSDDIN